MWVGLQNSKEKICIFGKNLVGPANTSEKLGHFRKKFVGGYQITPGTNFWHTFRKYLPDPPPCKLRFFPYHFQDPPIFFRKYKFFPLKFGDLPTFLRKIHIYLIFDPLTSRPLSVFEGLFSDIRFFDEFSSF